MTVLLRVVLDQLVSPTDPDLAMASRELAGALARSAPDGCAVGAIVPSGGDDLRLPGIAEVRRMGMGRRELAAAWQLGVTAGTGGGLIHSPTLLAPFARHDRINDHDQIVVTLWDLQPWENPDELSRTAHAWYKGMLKRARKHADAVVVPTHAMADRLGEFVDLGARVRVIAGAAPTGFRVPGDAVGRRRALAVPEAFLGLAVGTAPSASLPVALAAVAQSGVDLPIVVIDGQADQEPTIVELAEAVGIAPNRVHVRFDLSADDRAALLDASVLMLAPSRRSGFPWRVVEALALGVPVVAAASADHREVIVDGGLVVGSPTDDGQDAAALADGILQALASDAALARLGVLSGDRGRAFTWHDAAARVWQLHADL
ncbi:glycosyltransferase [Microbacterium sp.]|uniref:glycosyltransferase n=1 Tax=Microbacterium sp. TaxID=51671 RepID=UPI003A8E0F09